MSPETLSELPGYTTSELSHRIQSSCPTSHRKNGSFPGGLRLVTFLLFISVLVGIPQTVETGVDSIHAAELREKVFRLASPELKGRGNGSPELRVAAEYIAGIFEKNGVEPAGDAGTYYQNFRMFRAQLGNNNAFVVDGVRYQLGSDYVPHYLSPSATVEGPLVFVGYGVSAPHLSFDELAGVRLSGRIAVAIDRYPQAHDFSSDFNRIDPSDIGSVLTKARNVKDAGGLGLIILQNPDLANIPIAESAATFRTDYPRKDVPMGDSADLRNPEIPVLILSEAASRRIVPSLRNVQRLINTTVRPQSSDLEKRASLSVDVQRNAFPTQNVLGLIRGSDPILQREVVIVGAHYDHDGEYNGQIWPGADDNASGTAGLLELAEAFGNGRMKPARSILLCAFGGEEKGEIGSQHYADHPLIPITQTVAMIQMDMIGRNEEHPANRALSLRRETSEQNANSVNIIGSLFSPDLRRTFETSNRSIELDLKFRYDDTPENLMRRSDQWAFWQKGVPSLFVHTGEHPDYHRPSDTPDKINYLKMARIVQLVFLSVEQIANDPRRPAYHLQRPY